MPLLEFEDEDGRAFEVFFTTHGEFPCAIGEWADLGHGVRARRLPPSTQKPMAQEECFHVSNCHPPWWQAHRDMGGKFNSKGKAIFDDWDQVRSSVKHANAKYGEGVVYEGPTGVGEIH